MAKKKMTLEEKLEDAIVKDVPYEVPNNWIWVNSLKILDIAYGKNLSTKKLIDEGYPVFGANGYIGFFSEYNINEDKVLISCRGAYSGAVNFANKNSFVTNNSLIINQKDERISNKFLIYMLRAMNREQLISGTAQPQVTVKAFEDFTVVLPPLKEQQRIVDKVESLFEKLDKAKELIEEARDDFEKRKSAILEKAFRGELTDKVNLNAKEIQFIDDSTEFELFKSRYMLTNLSKIIIDKPRNGYSPKAVDYETSVKNLKLGAITRGKFNPNEFKYIDENIAEDSYLWLKNGDFLIQRANSLEYVGISAIYDMQDNLFIYPDLIMKFRVKEDAYLPQLLWYWINSRYGRWYFINNATGTAGNMPKINQKVVMNLPVPVIPLEEQKEIVKLLDGFFEQESKIEELTALEEQIELIKKSILAKAFRGQLGTNCEDDESALELLKKILSKE